MQDGTDEEGIITAVNNDENEAADMDSNKAGSGC